MGYGLVGVGMMGCEHIKNLLLLKEEKEPVQIAAIADPCSASRATALALLGPPDSEEAKSCKVYEDYGELIDDPRVSVVVVSTPNFHHFEVLRRAVASGPAGSPWLDAWWWSYVASRCVVVDELELVILLLRAHVVDVHLGHVPFPGCQLLAWTLVRLGDQTCACPD